MYVIIPARYGSSRLPGKPLLDVAGKTLIERVHDRARECGAKKIIIAADDDRVRTVAEGFGAKVCMTSQHHRSGTDRIAEVIKSQGFQRDDIIVNLQGDEPLMPPNLIRQVADTLAVNPDAVMATVCHRIQDAQTFDNPNVVKVVSDQKGFAMYFSRAAIPWLRNQAGQKNNQDMSAVPAYRHIGLYAYRAGFILQFTSWPICPMEEVEQLEQLRVLWHGQRIAVYESDTAPGEGIDTSDDLERVRDYFREKNKQKSVKR
jgi:3-deoxy-manno-octulosonate cytidylyltransferase (CMP-KDO synthetase)